MIHPEQAVQRRWRYYRTVAGVAPVRGFLDELPATDRQVVQQAMALVRREGTRAGRHLRGEIYEVRVATRGRSFRVLFAVEGARGQVLLALDAYIKQTQQVPTRILRRAELRLTDWRTRGQRHRPQHDEPRDR